MFSIVTVSCRPAVPCVPRTVVKPPSGMLADSEPAGGGGGGVVSSVENVSANGAPIAWPVASAIAAPSVNVCAVSGSSGATGRNVSSVLPPERPIVPGIGAPDGPVSSTLPAFAPDTVAGSMGSEKIATMAVDSATLVAPLAGVMDVTRGGSATSRRSSAASWRAAVSVTEPVPRSALCKSSAVSATAPTRAAATYSPPAPRDSATTGRVSDDTIAPATRRPPRRAHDRQ